MRLRAALPVLAGLLLLPASAWAQKPPATQQEEACPSPGPACPAGLSPVCHEGRWYCRAHVPGGGVAVGRLNFPTEAQRQAGACPDPALACAAPAAPMCRSGAWSCVEPARRGD